MRKSPILTLSVTAAAAIAANRFVGFDNRQIDVAGEVALGVADYPASGAGKQLAVDVLGTTKLEIGAPIAAGGLIQSDAVGRGIPLATGATQARALQAGSVVGQVIEVLLLPPVTPIA